MRYPIVWAAMLILALAGCSTAFNSEYQTATLVMPKGDPDLGRQVFIETGCTTCHRVHGESNIPQPVGATQGPELASAATMGTLGALTTSIIAPSHRVPAAMREEETDLSPMGDFSTTMTVRQLIDVVAYLESRAPVDIARNVRTHQ